MTIRSVALFGIALLTVGLHSDVRSQDPVKKERDPIMQKKLAHAQKVLEGLAVKDFDLIEKHADELSLLSKRAEWLVLRTPEYLRNGEEFRRNADTIVRMAKGKNLEGAALGYVQLTMNCVNCHQYVRDVRMAFLDRR
jgi:hypothetical protein